MALVAERVARTRECLVRYGRAVGIDTDTLARAVGVSQRRVQQILQGDEMTKRADEEVIAACVPCRATPLKERAKDVERKTTIERLLKQGFSTEEVVDRCFSTDDNAAHQGLGKYSSAMLRPDPHAESKRARAISMVEEIRAGLGDGE